MGALSMTGEEMARMSLSAMPPAVTMPNSVPSSLVTGSALRVGFSCRISHAWLTGTFLPSFGGRSKSMSRTCVRTVESSMGG